jgi:hypothetical protein
MPVNEAAIVPLGPEIPTILKDQGLQSWSDEVTKIIKHDLDELHKSVSILASSLSVDLIGPAGPQGPTGATGITGAAGATGAAGSNATGRDILLFSRGGAITGGVFLNIGDITMTSARGFPPHRAGSITGISGMVDVTIFTSSGTCAFNVQVNGITVFSVSQTITGTGLWTFNATQAAGVDTFAAAVTNLAGTNNRITVDFTFGGASMTVNPLIASLEVVYD